MPATVQQMKELVQVAREAVADFKEDDADLRRIAFERILDHMLAGAPDGAAASNGAAEDDWPPRTKSRRAGLVGLYFGIDPERAAELFDLSGREPLLRLQFARVPDEKTAATKLITLMVAGARAALGLDTNTAHIRDALEDHGVLDSANFADALSEMGAFVLLGEPGQYNRVVRLKGIGVYEAKECAARLVA